MSTSLLFVVVIGFYVFAFGQTISGAPDLRLPSPPETWTLTGSTSSPQAGSTSLYVRLYESSKLKLPLDQLKSSDIDDFPAYDLDQDGKITRKEYENEQSGYRTSDPILRAVASDLLVQFYKTKNPSTEVLPYDVLIRRHDGLKTTMPAELELGVDKHNDPFLYTEVLQWVRNTFSAPPKGNAFSLCNPPPWWLGTGPDAEIIGERNDGQNTTDDSGSVSSLLCNLIAGKVKEAIQSERRKEALRQELALAAYGQEMIWDGHTTYPISSYDTKSGSQLRTFDLMIDAAAAGNILGSGFFGLFFQERSQGEQCDSPLCQDCIFIGSTLCGDGGLQGIEQCDDGNRLPNDGCDEFCQVEGGYCGNGKLEPWEVCDNEIENGSGEIGKECPDGTPCAGYEDCLKNNSGDIQKTCVYDGTVCEHDSDCHCPSTIGSPALCKAWQKNSCAYVGEGVCWIGDIIEGSECKSTLECAGISECKHMAGKESGYCTNHPYRYCTKDKDCYRCTFEQVRGTCYSTGKICNNDDDCPSDYCMLEPENICRPRSIGGLTDRSSCNMYCEDVPRCGDRVTYLNELGGKEECDDGMHCANGEFCAFGQVCAGCEPGKECTDGSECKPRNEFGKKVSCNRFCEIQVCGDDVLQEREECDTGSRCIDGTSCDMYTAEECKNMGWCKIRKLNSPSQKWSGISGTCDKTNNGTDCDISSLDNPHDYEVKCDPDPGCVPRGQDGIDNCNESCLLEICGDGFLQKGEECDDGKRVCAQGNACTGSVDCPTEHKYCKTDPQTQCNNWSDCPNGEECLSPNPKQCIVNPAQACVTSSDCPGGTLCGGACTPLSNDGCSATCENEFCGDGLVQTGATIAPGSINTGEQCDPGIRTCSGGDNEGMDCAGDPDICKGDNGGSCVTTCDAASGCSGSCHKMSCGNGYIDAAGPDCNIDTISDNEECDDGNQIAGDGCSPVCKLEICGNGKVDPGEECDPGAECTFPDPAINPNTIGPGDSITYLSNSCDEYYRYSYNTYNDWLDGYLNANYYYLNNNNLWHYWRNPYFRFGLESYPFYWQNYNSYWNGGYWGGDYYNNGLYVFHRYDFTVPENLCHGSACLRKTDDPLCNRNCELVVCGDNCVDSPQEECDDGDNDDAGQKDCCKMCNFDDIECGDKYVSCREDCDPGKYCVQKKEVGSLSICDLVNPNPLDINDPFCNGVNICPDGETCTGQCSRHLSGGHWEDAGGIWHDHECAGCIWVVGIHSQMTLNGKKLDADGFLDQNNGEYRCIEEGKVEVGSKSGIDCTNDNTVCPDDEICEVHDPTGQCPNDCGIEGEVCGDGVVGAYEECDPGGRTMCLDNPSGLNFNFALGLSVCNGGVSVFENDKDCTSYCQKIECGDCDAHFPAEECDDGNSQSGDGCSASCEVEYCGDLYVDSDGRDDVWGSIDDEACDDGGSCGDKSKGAKSCQIDKPEQCADTSFVCSPWGGGACENDADCEIPQLCQEQSCYMYGVECGQDSDCELVCEPTGTGLCVKKIDGTFYCLNNGASCNGSDNDCIPYCDNNGGCMVSGEKMLGLSIVNVSCTTNQDCWGDHSCKMNNEEVLYNGARRVCETVDECKNQCNSTPQMCVQRGCDGCQDRCQPVMCGDGVVECGEECDDGGICIGTSSGDAEVEGVECSRLHVAGMPMGLTVCRLEGGDCYPENDDGCSETCQWEFCGDGEVQEGEQCDDGWENNNIEPDACRTDCRKAYCGDGVIDVNLGEECDVPTYSDGSYCTLEENRYLDTCVARSGDGGCSGNCLLEECGDLVVHWEYGEVCDDGKRCDDDQAFIQCWSDADCENLGDGLCLPRGGDGCSEDCALEISSCALDGFQKNGGDNIPGTADDEECSPLGPESGICPGGDFCDASLSEACDLGTCELASRTCSLNETVVCTSDADCQTPCVATCTEHCKNRARLCGDGVIQTWAGEQCDDGNPETTEEGGDGCSFYCRLENPHLCGNGRIDPGEKCDTHPLRDVECNAWCQFQQSAPFCGDGKKDPGGSARGDMLGAALASPQYRLDWRIPGGRQLAPLSTTGSTEADVVLRDAGGWYVTPRQPNKILPAESLSRAAEPAAQTEGEVSCSRCGDGVLNEGEQCDSGRTSGSYYPVNRVNIPAWNRHLASVQMQRYASAYYWSWHFSTLLNFSVINYLDITHLWYWRSWSSDNYFSYISSLPFGRYHQWTAKQLWNTVSVENISQKTDEQRTSVRELCSMHCRLQLCGNDRIDDGETCDDNNREQYGELINDDGCSTECFLENGYRYGTSVFWPNSAVTSVLCGDDMVSEGEECDTGGVCVTREKRYTHTYCRVEPGRDLSEFCDPDGGDDLPDTDDDEIFCLPVAGDGCSASCKIEPPSVCGNGIIEPNGINGVPSEECDVGKRCAKNHDHWCEDDNDCLNQETNVSSGPCKIIALGGCDVDCTFLPSSCGDAIIQSGNGETCDPGSSCVGGNNEEVSCSDDPWVCDGGTCEPVPLDSCEVPGCTRQGGNCGNGKIEAPEQCDQGEKNSDTEKGACRTNCLFPYCGDGVVDRGEECDDLNDPHCHHCFVDICGNGMLNSGEQCDDGNRQSGDGCSRWCIKEEVCGNGILDSGEQCDDGNGFSGDGCSGVDAPLSDTTGQCYWEYCGDGIVQYGIGEECDDGFEKNGWLADLCRPDCKLPSCGDGVKDAGEACDPARHCAHDVSVACEGALDCPLGACIFNVNSVYGSCAGDPNQGCSDDDECLVGECVVVPYGECGDDCARRAICGNFKREIGEECDDGKSCDDDQAFTQCISHTDCQNLGDGLCLPRDGDGCNRFCESEYLDLCGNGVIDHATAEECDDGNRVENDGCSAACISEIDFMECSGDCSLSSSTSPFGCTETGEKCDPKNGNADCSYGQCTLRRECSTQCVFGACGNGQLDIGEQCDNGRHCLHDSSIVCTNHIDCEIGSCEGADIEQAKPGVCINYPVRACMGDADCVSLCVPSNGDGCNAICRTETPETVPSAELRICQSDGSHLIGSGQLLEWQRTMLEPQFNQFMNPYENKMNVRAFFLSRYVWWRTGISWWMPSRYNDFLYSFPSIGLLSRSSWDSDGYGAEEDAYGGVTPEWWASSWSQISSAGSQLKSTYANGYYFSGCGRQVFPNSVGNHLHYTISCMLSIARYRMLPTRKEIMPFQPTGILTYAGCAEPRPQLTSVIQIPNVPSFDISEYEPELLVQELERLLCEEGGYPPRSVLAFCASPSDIFNKDAYTKRALLLESLREAGDYGGSQELKEYLEQAVGVLTENLVAADKMITDLSRIEFADELCPMNASTAFCPL